MTHSVEGLDAAVEELVPEANILGGLTTTGFRAAVAGIEDPTARASILERIEAARWHQGEGGDGLYLTVGDRVYGPPSKVRQVAAALNRAMGIDPSDPSFENLANYEDGGFYPTARGGWVQLGWSHGNPRYVGGDEYGPGMRQIVAGFLR